MKKITGILLAVILVTGAVSPVFGWQAGRAQSQGETAADVFPEGTDVLDANEEVPAGENLLSNPQGIVPSSFPREDSETDSPADTETDSPMESDIVGAGESIQNGMRWEGFTAEAAAYRRTLYNRANPDIVLYFRVVNQTDKELDLWLDDPVIDGVELLGTGIFNIAPGTDTSDNPKEEFAMIIVRPDHEEAGSEAICNAERIQIAMRLLDSADNSILCIQEVTITLSELEGLEADYRHDEPDDEIDVPDTGSDSSLEDDYDDYDADFGHGGIATAPIYIPASYNFRTLTQGCYGQDVRDLQQRLTDLGFLNDRVDGAYGLNTATAVMSFCDQHGLPTSGDATPQMQDLLFSSGAEYYVEPWIPLIIGPQYKWNSPMYTYLDNGTFYIQVVNRCNRTILGYELYYYITDLWGNVYSGDSAMPIIRRTTMQQTVQPGYLIDSPPITVQPWAWTYSVHVGIHKIIFSDGEIRELDDDEVVYFDCPVK